MQIQIQILTRLRRDCRSNGPLDNLKHLLERNASAKSIATLDSPLQESENPSDNTEKTSNSSRSSDSVPDYATLSLKGLIRMHRDPTKALQLFRWAAATENLSQNLPLFRQVFGYLLKADQFESARDLLFHEADPACGSIYEEFVMACCRYKFYSEAAEFFCEMISLGFRPTDRTCFKMLDCFVRARRPDLVRRCYRPLMQNAVSLDVRTIGCVVRAFCVEGKAYEALHSVQELLDSGWVPDIKVFNSVILWLCRVGDLEKAYSLIYIMISKGLMPTMTTYNRILDALFKKGNVKKALMLFQSLKERGYQPDVNSYAIVMDGLIKHGRLPDAMKIFKGMKGSINSVVCNLLVNGLCKYSDICSAWDFLENCIKQGFYPSTLTYNTLIAGYCERNDIAMAESTLKRMAKENLLPDTVTYNTLIQAHCKNDNVDKALGLFTELLRKGMRPTVSTFSPLINRLCMHGELQQGMSLLNQMIQRGLVPLRKTFDDFVLAFYFKGDMHGVVDMLRMVLDMGFRPSSKIFTTLIRGMCDMSMGEASLWVLQKMIENGYVKELDGFIFNPLVTCFCQHKSKDDVISFENLLKSIPSKYNSLDSLFGLGEKVKQKKGEVQRHSPLWFSIKKLRKYRPDK